MHNSKMTITSFSVCSVKYCNVNTIRSSLAKKMLFFRYKSYLFWYGQVKLALTGGTISHPPEYRTGDGTHNTWRILVQSHQWSWDGPIRDPRQSQIEEKLPSLYSCVYPSLYSSEVPSPLGLPYPIFIANKQKRPPLPFTEGDQRHIRSLGHLL